MGEEDMEKLKDLKAVYSGAIQCGEIGIANIIKSGIDLIEKSQKEVAQNYISKQKIKDLMGEKEWAIKSYDCSEADYKQSQAVGAWFACQRLLEERKK